ncbi:MAG: hypothetical protein ACRCZM_05215, partial [Bacteroidales bacterium]
DFYGVQILHNIPINEMIEELQLKQITDSTALLHLDSGIATLFYNTDLDIMGYKFENNHIRFEGNDYSEFIKVKTDFYNLLNKKRLSDKYLINNKFYSEELLIEKLIKRGNRTPLKAFDVKTYNKNNNAVIIYPDKVHGDAKAFEEFLQFVASADIDWLGLEMLNSDMQYIADDYIFADESSKEFMFAKDSIEAFYSVSWINHFKEKPKTASENPFVRLFQMMRERKIAIYGLEGSNADFLFFRNGETPFGGAVRNVAWARNTPSKGRGVVFGGSAHFTNILPINYQDILELLHREFVIYYLGN